MLRTWTEYNQHFSRENLSHQECVWQTDVLIPNVNPIIAITANEQTPPIGLATVLRRKYLSLGLRERTRVRLRRQVKFIARTRVRQKHTFAEGVR
jgi:hypothetical protein